MIPSTGIPKRIGTIYNRRPTSPWSEKEVRAYKQVAKTSLDILESELELIEKYYAFERRKGDKGIYRRDLLTLLNNWNGEVDRARAWTGRQKFNRTIKKIENGEKPLSAEEFQSAAKIVKQQLEEFRLTALNKRLLSKQ